MNLVSQDELEGSVGGSFLDDLLGLIDYPSEDEMKWYEDNIYIEMHWAGRVFRCVKNQRESDNGYLLEEDEWHEVTSKGLILVRV
jgi:hypothetical protein